LAKRSQQKTRRPEIVPREASVPRTAVTEAPGADLRPVIPGWRTLYSYSLLAALTLLCLLPFSGRAFHVDDTLFVWAAQQIAKHPLDPYGFRLTWDRSELPMAEVTQNPPLASYYAAIIGVTAGWSERALHLGFLLAPLALIIGTYRLAGKFTRLPLLAALATLWTPGILVSASSVMCDTMMLALWVWAVIFWMEGVETQKPLLLMTAALLISAAALTKYFGLSLIPLLLVYSAVRTRRIGSWACYMVIPIIILAGYEFWTAQLYGHGLLSTAAEFAGAQRVYADASVLAMTFVGTSFTGGCALPALLIAPLIWPRKWMVRGAMLSAIAAAGFVFGEIHVGLQMAADPDLAARHQHLSLIGAQLTLCIGGGLSALALALTDYRKRRDAASLLLGLWVLGTFVFAAYLNYAVNARSVLPLIPAVGILAARRCEQIHMVQRKVMMIGLAIALLTSAFISLCVAQGDAALANSARHAAEILGRRTRSQGANLWFGGHWGFQYYMQALGARPMDYEGSEVEAGDFVALPQNNVGQRGIQRQFVASSEVITLPLQSWASTICAGLGAGFYSSYWGPLPYAFGSIPPEEYALIRVARNPQ
jgi:hypothetical protein